jgi:DNA-binding transcriptional regulator YiaG
MTRRPKSARHMRAMLDDLGLSQLAAARFLRRSPRQVRRWVLGEAEPPFAERALLELMVAKNVSVQVVEQIADV